MLPLWHLEAYKAQAVVARTYALFELRKLRTAIPTTICRTIRAARSTVALTPRPCQVRAPPPSSATYGTVVVTSGPPGPRANFQSLFQQLLRRNRAKAAYDAFGDPPSEPLTEQSFGTLCGESPHFSWPPVIVSKREELTKRFRHFGALRNRVEKDMAPVIRIDVAANNKLGRPVRFVVTDAKGNRYTWTGEEIRWAVDTDATDTTKLKKQPVPNRQSGCGHPIRKRPRLGPRGWDVLNGAFAEHRAGGIGNVLRFNRDDWVPGFKIAAILLM